MKTVQKLEIAFGLATLLASVVIFIFSAMPAIKLEAMNGRWDIVYEHIFSTILFGLIPALLIGIGSFFHAVYRRGIWFGCVLVGGTALILIFGMNLLSLAAVYFYGTVGGLLVSTPGLLAAVTVFLSFRSRKNSA